MPFCLASRAFLARRASRLPIVVAGAGAAVAVTAVGVYALLTATAHNTTPQDVDSGTLSLTLGDVGTTGFSSGIAGLAPGDSVRRYVTLTNGGTLAGTALKLAVSDGTPTKLTTDPAEGLQVEVQSCSVAWSLGTCAGTTTTEVSAPMAALGTAAPLAGSDLAPGAVRHLRITVTLPDQDETTVNGVAPAGTVQGLSAALTWTFSETQRAATSS